MSTNPHPTLSRVKVPAPIGHLIFALHGLLKFYYKTDFSYTIMGNGAYLGASNAQAGRIEPYIEPGE